MKVNGNEITFANKKEAEAYAKAYKNRKCIGAVEATKKPLDRLIKTEAYLMRTEDGTHIYKCCYYERFNPDGSKEEYSIVQRPLSASIELVIAIQKRKSDELAAASREKAKSAAFLERVLSGGDVLTERQVDELLRQFAFV